MCLCSYSICIEGHIVNPYHSDMVSTIRIIFRNTFTYGVVTIIGRAINYFLVPLYTCYLSPASYGVVTEIYSFIAVSSVLFTYSMEVAFFRFTTSINKAMMFRQFQTLLFCSSTMLSILTIIVLHIMGYSIQHSLLVCGILIVDTILLIPFASLRQDGNLKKFVVLKVSQILVNVFLNVVFICFDIFAVDHVTSILLANLLSNATALAFLKVCVPMSINRDEVRRVLSFCSPLTIMGMFGIANDMWLRMSLRYLLPNNFYDGISNENIIGIVGANYKIGALMSLFVQTFKYAADPILLKLNNTNSIQSLRRGVMHYFVMSSCVVWLFIDIFKGLICSMFLRRGIYHIGLKIVPIIAFNYLLYGIYYNLSMSIKVANKNLYLSVFSIICFVVTVMFSVMLIPYYGYTGGVVANSISYLMLVVLTYVESQKIFYINYNKADIVSLSIILIIMVYECVAPPIVIVLY